MSHTLSWASLIRAEGKVRALTEDGHEGMAHVLTGPEPISAVQQAEQLAEVLGQRLDFEELDPESARELYLRRYPPELAEALLHSAERQRAGAKSEVADTVQRVTGRPARSYAQWAADHAELFGAPDFYRGKSQG